MSKVFVPSEWFWIVDNDESLVYSAAAAGFVLPINPEFEAFLADGGVPSRVDSLDDLRHVLLAQYPAGWQKTVGELKVEALTAIDAAAGAARARYITVAPGQEATYLMKGQQARDYAAAGYTGPVPLMVAAEQEAAGDASAQAAANRIIAEEAAWSAKAAQIEKERRSRKIAVVAAVDAESVAAIRTAAETALSAM